MTYLVVSRIEYSGMLTQVAEAFFTKKSINQNSRSAVPVIYDFLFHKKSPMPVFNKILYPLMICFCKKTIIGASIVII